MGNPASDDSGRPREPSRGPLRRLVNRLEVDRAVFYAICLRCWQLVAGPISMLMIGLFFSGEIQGYYYTFASLMALQSFFELGLHIVILNASSHEWLHLGLDRQGRVVGDARAKSRLVSLGRLLFRWYGAAAALFAVVVGVGGAMFLSRGEAAESAWRGPWAAVVLLHAAMLWTMPFVVMLEGCGQIAVVNRYRVVQAVAANLAIWTAILWGWGLWAAVASAAARWLGDLALLGVRYRRFFASFVRPALETRLSWQRDIWPMQWRLAIGGIVSYFAFALMTPVMFHYHGSLVAGRMGMTWQLVAMLQAVALAWVHARAPLFGRLIARQDYRELDRVFRRLVLISLAVVCAGAAALGLAVWTLNCADSLLAAFPDARLAGFRLAPALQLASRLGDRMLPPAPTAALLAGIVCYHLPHCQAYYLRAHKREPLLVAGVVSNLLLGLAIWRCGMRGGALGASLAYLAVIALVIFPWFTATWWTFRQSRERENAAVLRE